MDGEYKLRAQLAGRGHVATARVRVTDAQHPSVVLDDHMFDWAFDAYGPNAYFDSRFFDDLRNGALSGAVYALHRLRIGGLVHVLHVFGGTADASEADIRFVVAQAVWNALGRAPEIMPAIDSSGTFQFPNPPFS